MRSSEGRGSTVKALCLRSRSDERGFSLVELVSAVFVMGLIIGIGIWMLFSSRSTMGARSAQMQIAQDVKLCAKKAETEKKAWGILFYSHDYPHATWHNAYRWYWFEGDGNTEGTDCTIRFSQPPQGATPAEGHVQRVPLPDGANVFGTFGSTWPSNARYLYLRFKPVGSVVVTQYGRWSGGVRVWADISDSPGHLKIDVSDRKNEMTESTIVNKLGYVWLQ